MNCHAHQERANQQVEATHMIDGEPMCERCYRGYAINGEVENAGVPHEEFALRSRHRGLSEKDRGDAMLLKGLGLL